MKEKEWKDIIFSEPEDGPMAGANRGYESGIKNWKTEIRGGVSILTLNVEGRSANVLTMEVMKELFYLLLFLSNARIPKIDGAGLIKGLIIRSGKENGFIFGADVEEFQNVKTAEEAEKLAKYGQTVFRMLEVFPAPTVAAINGTCVGGGLELALACKYRVGQDNAKLGLPEVLLGIHPGFGGTVRLPKLIGDSAALQMTLTGKPVDAKKAKKIGLIDEVVPERHLLNAAIAWLMKNPGRKKPPLKNRLAGLPFIRRITAKKAKKMAAKKANPKHYPAPNRMINLWLNRAGYGEEAKSLGETLVSETSRNLVRLFLTREKLKKEAKKNQHNVKRVHVVGAGKMGGDIAAHCAAKGFTVSITDHSEKQIAGAVKSAYEFFKRKLKDPLKIREAMDRFIPDAAGDCAKKADLVIEAIVEKAEPKKKLFAALEKIVPSDAILATNTSGIPLETLAESLENPSRLVGLHFFNPATVMEVVEVIRGENTSEEIFNRAKSFTAAIDKIPISVKSSPGFLINRCLMPYLIKAVQMAGEGTPMTDIDKSAVEYGMPMGPIELADEIGLDVCLLVAEELSAPLKMPVPDILKKMVAEKKFGKKTGKGFYEYENGKKISRETGKADNLITGRLIMAIAIEVKKCLELDIVGSPEELNVGMVFGTGYAPFRGGPYPLPEKEPEPPLDDYI